MEIHLVRTSLGLQAYGDEDYEMLRKIKIGSVVKATDSATKEREISQKVLLTDQCSLGLPDGATT